MVDSFVVGWRTYTYLDMLEELRGNANNVQTEVEVQTNQRNGNLLRSGTSNLPAGDLESGSR